MRTFLVFLFMVICLETAGQRIAGEIVIKGKAIDISTGKAIKANISYKSLPTGGITGRFLDSIYSFSIFGASRYEISAELNGYIPAVAIVDPAQAQEGELIREL